ncbi:MAG: hypothetical protein AAGF91_01880 [Actinomycetota bacterium]
MSHLDPSTTRDDDVTTNDSPDTGSTDDRRSALRKIALGGAGAAVGVLALRETAHAGDEAGTPTVDTNALELGEASTNTAVTPTSLAVTPAAAVTQGPSMLSVGAAVPAVDAPFPAQAGGYGDDNVPNGLHGSTTALAGFGAVAANLSAAAPDDTTEAPGALAVASANGAHIKFVLLADPVSGPTPGAHVAGEMYVDADGTLWFTVPTPPETIGGDPGVRFVKLAGNDTAGSLHFLPEPVRIADTREGGATKPAAGSTNVYDTKLALDGTTATGVPAGATGVELKIVAAQTGDPAVPTAVNGYFTVAAAGTTFTDDPTFSSGNWDGIGQIVSTSALSAVDADAQIAIFLGPESGCHLIVDVIGYYL